MRITTTRFSCLKASDLGKDGCACFVASSTEERGRLPMWDEWEHERPRDCVVVCAEEAERIEVQRHGAKSWFSLRDFDGLAEIFFSHQEVYIDMSGLSHHVWVALVQAASRMCRVKLIYAEPQSYRRHPSPTSLMAFDLSSEIGGLAPLPGLARLSGPLPGQSTVFVAFLGFEGTRPLHLIEQLDEQPTDTVPVVGVPGFRFEYPTVAVSANAAFLREHDGYHAIKFAGASDPQGAYTVLEEVRREYPNAYLLVAPVGTKPHTLGAVLYALDHPENVELLYDHPRRRPKRTEGVGTVHVYELQS